jgi:hypothetical protein
MSSNVERHTTDSNASSVVLPDAFWPKIKLKPSSKRSSVPGFTLR